ncbi:MAG: hypothetical protein ALAOOOJD_02269 [bacterium]|nr:hypothetical protein [bacterium]
MFALAEMLHGFFIGGIDQQMKSANAFHGHNLAAQERIDRLEDRVIFDGERQPFMIPQLHLRPAPRAGIRLRVKTPVGGIVIFGATIQTHRKTFHRGVRTIIRQRRDDRKARTAVGAIGERITIAPVGRIKNFSQTIRTGGNVGQNKSAFLTGFFAVANFKSGVTKGIKK